MKNIKLIFVSLFIAATVVSCEDDGGDSVINLQNGGTPDIQKTETSETFINLTELQDGNDINIGVTVDIALGDVRSMDVVGYYIKANGTAEKAVLADDVTTFPTTVTLSRNDLLELFSTLNSVSDFGVGDQLKISADVTLNTGAVVNLLTAQGGQNYGSYIEQATYRVYQTFNVSCPSDLGGTYNVVSSGASTDSGVNPSLSPISNYAYTTTITDNGGGNYTLTDAYGGLYLLWYDIFGITGPESGTFTDVCGTLRGSFAEPFGTTVTLTGTVNDNGTLSIQWVNGYGDQGASVYTRVP